MSWSSGKDSAWLVHVLRQKGEVEIGAVLTTINEAADRVAMRAVRTALVEAQARALERPMWRAIPFPCSNEASLTATDSPSPTCTAPRLQLS